MVFDEYELKYLISKKDYDKLSKVFSDSTAVTFEQVNYYYDTFDQKLRKTILRCESVKRAVSLWGKLRITP